MATNYLLLGLLSLLFLGAGTGTHEAVLTPETDISQRLRRVYTVEIGVREATGKNDGERVETYLRYVGLGPGYAWCAAYVCFSLGQAGIANPKNGWSPALFPARRLLKKEGEVKPEPGDVFGLYSATAKRINHCGFVDEWGSTWVTTVEGNVDNAVVRKRRLVKSIHAVSRWR